MARITVEDCSEKVPNRFHLVQMAAIRTKQLKKGATPLVQSEENKHVVISLREIAAGYVTPDYPGGEGPEGPEAADSAAGSEPAEAAPAE